MRVEWVRIGSAELLALSGVGRSGRAGEQITALHAACADALRAEGLTMADALFHRLWLRSRDLRDEVSPARSRLFAGEGRTASSSFISAVRCSGGADVALELVAVRPTPGAVKRIVDFDPPRRYAHYAVRGDLLLLSGMAEEAATIEGQLERALAAVEAGLAAEQVGWAGVLEAHLFLERGKASPAWLRSAFESAAGSRPLRTTCELVDGLASPGKHLEIEVIACRPSAGPSAAGRSV